MSGIAMIQGWIHYNPSHCLMNVRSLNLEDEEVLYFLHIPKTAGTSFQYYLAQRFSFDEICPAQTQRDLQRISPERLARYRLFAGHFWGLSKYLETRAWMITMLREPLKRVKSYYKHILRDPSHHLHAVARSSQPEVLTRFPDLRNEQTRQLAAHHGDYDQRMPDGDCLPLAKEVLQSAKFVGIVERLEMSMQLLAHTFAWPPMPALPKINTASPEQMFPQGLQEHFQEANRMDEELYAFANDILERRCARVISAAAVGNYERTLSRSLQRPPVVFAMENAICGNGWYEAEKAEPEGFRWSGPERIASLDLPVIPRHVKEVRLGVCVFTSPEQRGTLRLRVNGMPVELKKEGRSVGVIVYIADLREMEFHKRHNLLHLQFEVERTHCPAETGKSLDRRKLGIALSWVEVR